jgi:DNA-binding transcriptional regulator YiaG
MRHGMDLSMPCRIVEPVNELQTTEQLAHARQLVASGAARRIRRAADLSLAEVSRAIGVDLSTVGRWERRERVPRGAAAIKYARLLHRLQMQTAKSGEVAL